VPSGAAEIVSRADVFSRSENPRTVIEKSNPRANVFESIQSSPAPLGTWHLASLSPRKSR
jgi:hypothetical protein